MNSAENKIQKTLKEEEDGDRISRLTDDILSKILSLLPTKHAVATAVLSTRWRQLFISVPNLDLDDRWVLKPESSATLPRQIDLFTISVDKVLQQRNTCDSFCLYCSVNYGRPKIERWIRGALKLNAKILDVFVHQRPAEGLPPEMFVSTFLEGLRLMGHFTLSFSFAVHLPKLKVFHLDSVTFADSESDSVEKVFSGCPLLHDLVLDGCKFPGFDVLNLSIPSLKSLIIVDCEGKYQMEFNTPMLEDLELSDLVYRTYVGIDMHSLVTARLKLILDAEEEDFEGADTDRSGVSQAQFVECFHSIEFLSLSGQFLSAIYDACCMLGPLGTFENLTRLEFDLDCTPALSLMLESAPNLEYLAFFVGKGVETGSKLCVSVPESVPSCLSLHLKEIIYAGQFDQDELELVEYFLGNGEVLQKLTIRTCAKKTRSDMCKWVSMLPKKKACQITLLDSLEEDED